MRPGSKGEVEHKLPAFLGLFSFKLASICIKICMSLRRYVHGGGTFRHLFCKVPWYFSKYCCVILVPLFRPAPIMCISPDQAAISRFLCGKWYGFAGIHGGYSDRRTPYSQIFSNNSLCSLSIMIRIPENAYNLNYPEIKPSSGFPFSSHDIWLQGTRPASFCSYD